MDTVVRYTRPRGLVLELPAYQEFVPANAFRVGEMVGGRYIGYLGKEFAEALPGLEVEHADAARFTSHVITGTALDSELFAEVGRPEGDIGFVRAYQLMDRTREDLNVCYGKNRGWNNWTYVRVRGVLKAMLITRRGNVWILGLADVDEGFRVGVLHIPLRTAYGS